ncbi:MAG: T9SS type A sorting domain-containing protein [Bacteroidales bacterium]|nr:T9SS type A sorting domain-containing protein [Bacteroidales bacterium]MDD3011893.1 T9SS type A sorting domain-containing protein [Bacteroidales bacterium]MDD3962798.1 T9SS type A sorting domain-containing protein [Bacteroidales bacterium]MDY0286563.1 T9SS type A sorting domain-containing protein [Bacteroidales bacterium]
MKNIIFFITLFISLVVVKPDYAQNFFEEISIPDTVFIQCMEVNGNGDIFLGSLAELGKGGVYRLLKGDSIWECVYPFPNGGAPLSIEIMENGTIYVGTNSGYWEHYLLRSFDNGDTWEGVDIPGRLNVISIYSPGEDSIILSRFTPKPTVVHTLDNGETWACDTVTTIGNNVVYDFPKAKNQSIYAAMMCFSSNHGGVYKSNDFGETWDFDGQLNHQVMSVAVNSIGDLFSADWYVTSSVTAGLYCKRHGEEEYELVQEATGIGDLVIAKEDCVYACTEFSIFYTCDYGQTIETIDDPLCQTMRHLALDNEEYLYGAHEVRLIRSLQPLGSNVNVIEKEKMNIEVFPNPVQEVLCISAKSHNYAFSIKLFDFKGNIVSEVYEHKEYHCLNTSDLIPGVYLLYVEDLSNKISITKILKQ